MADILVYLQSNDDQLMKAGLCALTAAKQLRDSWSRGRIVALLLGRGAKTASAAAATLPVDEVRYCEDGELENYRAAHYAGIIVQQMKSGGFDTFVCAATSIGKDLSPVVAASIDAGQASDIVAVNGDGTITRPMYAGDVLGDVEIVTPNKVVTVRPTAFAPVKQGSNAVQVSALAYIAPTLPAVEFVSYETSGGDRPELGDAEVVVSGGRALQSAENFEKILFPLADVLKAAVGASRAAVDSGYAPNDWQVGQTGKVVAPQLYLAVGISGAIQHLAGMKDSKVIVAINKDGDAPIFEVADYGLVADLFDVVPRLTEEIRKAKG